MALTEDNTVCNNKERKHTGSLADDRICAIPLMMIPQS